MTKLESKLDTRQEYRDFASELHGCPFEKIGKGPELTRALAKFYISKIHNLTKTVIDDEEFDDGYVDGASDLDIDLIHKDDNKVLIVQSRYHGVSASPEDAKNISRFQGVLSRMRKRDFKPNTRLQDILGSIDWERDNFELVYITFAKISGQALAQTQEMPVYPDDVSGLEDRCTWEFLGEQEIAREFRQASSLSVSRTGVVTTLASAGKKGDRSGVLELKSGQFRSFVLAVEAAQLVSAYNSGGKDALFSLNIRNYLGNTKNNQKLIKTAQDSPESFFYFNNGISCLAEQVEVAGEKIVVKSLQVINGAQTVKGLVRAAGVKGKAESWDRHQPVILVRVTEVGGYGSEGAFREEITRYNNTQNVIKDADFKSNDAIQRDLAKKFADISRAGKRVAYLPKRTDIKPSAAEVIRLEDFAKVVYAFLGDPISFSGSTSFLFDEERGYSRVFGDGTSPWQTMPMAEFKLRAAIYWLGIYFEERVRQDKSQAADPIVRAALERKWFPIYISRLLLERAYPEDGWRVQMERLYKGDWRVGESKARDWVDKVYELSKQILLGAYRAAAREPKFVHRNWTRSPSTVVQLKDAAGDLSEFMVKTLAQ